MKKNVLMFAAFLIVSLAAFAQGQKRFNLYAVGFIIRRISSILAMMRARMIMNIFLPRDGTE